MRCSGAVYSSIFIRGAPCTTRGSGCFTRLDLDRLELYSNHISHNNSQSYGGRGGVGGVGGYSVVKCEGCARDQHALCASGPSLTSPPISKNRWVSAAGDVRRHSHGGPQQLQASHFSPTKEQANIKLVGIRTTATRGWKYVHDITNTSTRQGVKKGSKACMYRRRGSGTVCLE